MSEEIALMPGEPTYHAGVPQAQTTNMLSVIERAASNPAVDVDKMRSLLEMQERIMTKQAEIDFNQSMTRLMAKLPIVDKTGRIEFTDKNGEVRSTPFAKYEDIDAAIRPVMIEEGFSLSFDTTPRDGGGVIITGTLSHSAGHKKTASMPVALDTTGSKNNIQSMGSSLSYGKRYVVGLLLNIITRGEDTDGIDRDTPITTEQAVEIDLLVKEVAADKPAFLRYMAVNDIRDIKAIHYNKAKTALNQKKNANIAKGAK